MFLISLCDSKFVQFLSTGSSFPHIMIGYVLLLIFVKPIIIIAPFRASNNFPLESNSIADDENDNKTIFISFVKNLEQSED